MGTRHLYWILTGPSFAVYTNVKYLSVPLEVFEGLKSSDPRIFIQKHHVDR
jgi:hypothetical protein